MKAITVWQPWAQLIVTGQKRCETRPWATSYRGEILIHAGKKSFYDGVRLLPIEAQQRLREYFEPNGDRRLRVDAIGYLDRHFPTGAIVGRAKLVNCVQIDALTQELIRKQYPEEYQVGDFSVGRFAWVLEEPELFKNPVPASGKQRLWEYYGDLEEV